MSTVTSETPRLPSTREDCLDFLINTFPDQKIAQECFASIKKRIQRNPNLTEEEIGRRVVNAMNERSGVSLRRELGVIYESMCTNYGEKIREYGLAKWDHHIQALLCQPIKMKTR